MVLTRHEATDIALELRDAAAYLMQADAAACGAVLAETAKQLDRLAEELAAYVGVTMTSMVAAAGHVPATLPAGQSGSGRDGQR